MAQPPKPPSESSPTRTARPRPPSARLPTGRMSSMSSGAMPKPGSFAGLRAVCDLGWPASMPPSESAASRRSRFYETCGPGGEWRCTGTGTPGTWIQIRPAALTADPSTGTVPIGYLILNVITGHIKRHAGGYSWEIAVSANATAKDGFHGQTPTAQRAGGTGPRSPAARRPSAPRRRRRRRSRTGSSARDRYGYPPSSCLAIMPLPRKQNPMLFSDTLLDRTDRCHTGIISRLLACAAARWPANQWPP